MNAAATARHERSLANCAHVRYLLARRFGIVIPPGTARAITETRYELCPSCGGLRPRTIAASPETPWDS